MGTARDDLAAAIDQIRALAGRLDVDDPQIVAWLHQLANAAAAGRDTAVPYRRMLGDTWANLGAQMGRDPRNMTKRYSKAVAAAQRRAAGSREENH